MSPALEMHHLIPLDVDGDGDLDLLGNVEEHFHRGPDGRDVSWFSVVWFENPRNSARP